MIGMRMEWKEETNHRSGEDGSVDEKQILPLVGGAGGEGQVHRGKAGPGNTQARDPAHSDAPGALSQAAPARFPAVAHHDDPPGGSRRSRGSAARASARCVDAGERRQQSRNVRHGALPVRDACPSRFFEPPPARPARTKWGAGGPHGQAQVPRRPRSGSLWQRGAVGGVRGDRRDRGRSEDGLGGRRAASRRGSARDGGGRGRRGWCADDG